MSTPQLFLPNYGFSLSSGYATSSQEADYAGVAEAAVALARAECHEKDKEYHYEGAKQLKDHRQFHLLDQ